MKRNIYLFLFDRARTSALLCALVPAILLPAGCGEAPPVREPISPLYSALTDEFTDFDFCVLRDKKVLIDPGHGGRFTGTTGQNGLKEKSVNLGVSLYLWGLLKEAGAEAYLTRAADRDFLLEQAESDLTRDLAARVAMSDSLDPDLFLSVHHNARGDTNRAFNQIEVYYPMADDGPSRDAAHAIFHHLKRNLGEAKGRVIPGNFYVLRENDAPAVLGESSYLSHPPVEQKLKLSDMQRLEAEAYFLGITRYFMSGAPRAWFVAESEAVDTDSAQTDRGFVPAARRDTIRSIDKFHVQAVVRDEDGFAGVDPSTIELTLDGEPLPHRFLPGSDRVQAALPYDIANAEHELTLRAQNLHGNSTKVARREVLVDLPVDDVETKALRTKAQGRTRIFFSFRITDARGLAVRSQRVQIAKTFAGRIVERETGPLFGGQVSNLSLESPINPQELELQLPESDSAVLAFSIPAIIDVPSFVQTDERRAALWQGDKFLGFTDQFGIFESVDPQLKEEDFSARTRRGRSEVRHSVDSDAVGPPGRPGSESYWLDGLVESGEVDPRYTERRILIDPNGMDDGTQFPGGEQAVRLARMLQEMFAFYELPARLTHESPSPPRVADRIYKATSWNATYWITIEPSDSLTITHFPTSRFGGPNSELTARVLESRFGHEVPVLTSTRTELRDTPCTAIVIGFPPVTETDALTISRLRTIAQAVSEGLTRCMIYQDWPMDLVRIREKYEMKDRKAGELIRVNDRVTYQVLRNGPWSPWEVVDPGNVREIWTMNDGVWKEYPVPDHWKGRGWMPLYR